MNEMILLAGTTAVGLTVVAGVITYHVKSLNKE